jgi:hypothetical protein
MNTWVVGIEYDYEPGSILGIFSTMDKANEYADTVTYGDRVVIWLFTVDEKDTFADIHVGTGGTRARVRYL